MSDDDPFSTPNRPPVPPRTPKPGELLFEFHGHDRILCELCDDGDVYGVEAQFFRNETFEIGRRFERRMDPTRTPGEMAIAWAEEWRKAIETDGWET
jgi:hypothetical protein